MVKIATVIFVHGWVVSGGVVALTIFDVQRRLGHHSPVVAAAVYPI